MSNATEMKVVGFVKSFFDALRELGYEDAEVREAVRAYFGDIPSRWNAPLPRIALEPRLVHLIAGLRHHQVVEAVHLLLDYIDAKSESRSA